MYMIIYIDNNLNNYFSINNYSINNYSINTINNYFSIDELNIYHALRNNNCLCCNSIVSKENWSVSKTIFDFVLEYRQLDIIIEFNNKNLQEIFDSTRLSLLNDDIIRHILTFVM